MPHSIWTGDISFGLVTIPVEVRPAEEPRNSPSTCLTVAI